MICALFPFLLSGSAYAAEITSGYTDNGIGSIHYSGDVENGDYEKFVEVYEQLRRSGLEKFMVVLNSNGGDVGQGVRIGMFIAEKKMATVVESGMHCFSSCISIFAAGTPRTAYPRSKLGVHRAADMKLRDNSNARSVSISLNDYYRRFNVPDSVRIAMIDTPPNKIYLLTEKEIKSFNTQAPLAVVPASNLTLDEIKKKVMDAKLQALEFMDQGKFLDAVRTLEKMKSLAANDYELFSMLGKAHFMSGNRNQAIINYSSSVKINPHHADSWRALGELVADDGNIEWATQCFVKYYDNMTDKNLAFSVLEGLSYANKGQRKDLAASSARKKIRK
jgi:hypothetical protein